MKKTISILLIVTMLLSMIAVAVPVGATSIGNGLVGYAGGDVNITTSTPGAGVTGAGTVTAPGAATGSTVNVDNVTIPTVNATGSGTVAAATGAPTTAGIANGVTVGSDVKVPAEGKLPLDTWDKPWGDDNNPQDGWIAVDDYSDISKNDGGAQNGKKYYLIADITVNNDNASQSISTGFIIDGNGHTIHFGGGRTLMACANNAVIRNVKLTGKIDGTVTAANQTLSPIGGHNHQSPTSNKKVEFYNVWSDVDVKVNGDAGYAGGLISVVGDGSVFENVIVTGDIETTASSAIENIGGIVGEVSGTVRFTNCAYVGNINAKNAASQKIGGIVGKVAGTTTFTNCLSDGTLTTMGANSSNYVGGIAGVGNPATAITNCTSSIDIIANGNGTSAWLALGGLVGCSTGIKKIEKTVFNGSITYSETSNSAVFVGGLVGLNNGNNADNNITTENTKVSGSITVSGSSNSYYGIAGFVGWSSGALSFANCESDCDIDVDGVFPYVSGMVGDCSKAITCTSCDIGGTISLNYTGTSTAYVSGLHRTGRTSTTVSNSRFAADIEAVSAQYVGAVIGIADRTGGAPTVKDCTVAGTISATNAASEMYVGGFVAYGDIGESGNKFRNCISSVAITVGGKLKAVGGFVGFGPSYAYYDNLTFNGSITVNSDAVFPTDNEENGVGGVIGVFNADWMYTNCLVGGSITVNGPANHVGGFVGSYPNSQKKLGNCGSANNLVNTNITVNANVEAVGGFVGYVSKLDIEKTTFAGSVSVTGNTTGVGGLAGVQNEAAARINNCVVSGDISAKGTVKGLGGFIGVATAGAPNVVDTNVFEGSVTLKTGSNISQKGGVGGFAGYSAGATYLKNFETKAKADKNAVSGIVIEKNITFNGNSGTTWEGGFGGVLGMVFNAKTTLNTVINGAPVYVEAKGATRGNLDDGIGGVAGHLFQGNHNHDFDYVYNTADITFTGDAGNSPVAALVGYTYESYIDFDNCGNTGKITSTAANYHVGGFFGKVHSPKGTFTYDNCFNAGDIEITNGTPRNGTLYVAGFVASNQGTHTFNNCINTGDIKVTAAAANAQVGGIHAWSAGGTFTKCTNSGDITVEGSAQNVGGIVGYYNGTINFDNCSVSGAINVNNTNANGVNVGGVVGYANALDGNPACEGNLVTVDISVDGVVKTVGGIVGYVNQWASIASSKYDGDITVKETAQIATDYQPGTRVDNSGKTWYQMNNKANTGVGGFAGFIASDCYLYKNIVDGSITVKADVPYVGGLIGRSAKSLNGGKHYNNLISTDITVEAGVTAVGGYAGKIETADIKDSTFNGSIVLTDASSYMVNTYYESETEDNTNFKSTWTAKTTYAGGIGGFIGVAGRNGLNATLKLTNCLTDVKADANEVSGIVVETTAVVPHHEMGIGGLVGQLNYQQANVKDSLNKMPIAVSGPQTKSGYDNGVGGIVGNAFGSNTVHTFNNADNLGDITLKTGSAGWNVGGILGYWYSSSASFTNCDNGGDIDTVANNYVIGGISGYGFNTNADNVYTNCSNSGAITVSGGTAEKYSGKAPEGVHIGGIAARVDRKSTFTGCINTGDITYGENVNVLTTAMVDIGGMIGTTAAVVSLTDSANTGDITVTGETNNVAGFIGYVGGGATFDGCENRGNIDVTGESAGSWLCFSGFIGRKGSGVIEFTACRNRGAITADVTIASTIKDKYILVGGFMGVSNSGEVTFKSCINEGDIDVTCVGSAAGASATAGFLGWTNTTVGFDNCINDAAINAAGDVADVAGLIGYVGNPVTINECMNLASDDDHGVLSESANSRTTAGGFAGYATYALTVTDCYNQVPVALAEDNETGYAGGIVGNATAVLTVSDCINTGDVSGIQGCGIVGYVGNGASSITDCIVTGAMVENGTNHPIATGFYNYDNNYYLEGSFEEVYDEADEVKAGKELDDVISATDIWATYGFDRLEAAIDEAEALFADEDTFAVYSWNRLIEAYEPAAVTAAKDRNVRYEEQEDGSLAIEFLTQAEVNYVYYALRTALDGMRKKGEMPLLLKQTIADAEKYASENEGTVYFDDAWNAYVNALAAAKTVMVDPDIQVEVDPVMIETLANNLKKAVEALPENKGGYIRTEEDFAKLNGQDGIFYLESDVTVTEAVESFMGTLVGNGHTVTVEKNSLFNNFGGNASDMTVTGNAEGAAAVFGKASGNAEIDKVIVTVKSFESAIFFSGAEEGAEVVVTNVLASAKADALVEGKITLKNAYHVGGEYYAPAGNKRTDKEIAAGLAAVNINNALGAVILIQTLGKDKHPTIGTPAADGSNVVTVGSDGKIENKVKFDIITDEVPELGEIRVPEVHRDNVDAALKAVEELKAENYDANSWAIFQIILAASKEVFAIKDATQDSLDTAALNIHIGIANLKKKVAPVVEEEKKVDYTKLEESIAKAQALKEADYTVETWGMLKAMLDGAIAAKNSSEQAVVNSAKNSLDSIMLRLKTVKVDEPAPETPEDPATEESGCGSVVGGSAIALAAVLALGAGVAFKKKED